MCCFQTFEFNVPWEQIRECALDIAVMDFDTIGRNELIGQLFLAGMQQLINRRDLIMTFDF